MQRVAIDPSIGVELDIKPVSYRDTTPLYFEIDGEQTWTGQFDLKMWNSSKKNHEFPITGVNPISYQDKILTWEIKPRTQGIQPSTYYFEIFSSAFDRIIFRGTLPIID